MIRSFLSRNTTRIRTLCLLFLFSFLFNSSVLAQSLESEIQEIIDRYQVVGTSVAVVKDNKICYTRTFGYSPDYSDPSLRKAISPDGKFFIASISKSFIATAIMQLAEKNLLKLDDDVNKYFDFMVRNPKYPNEPITIRMLMSHRSSINNKYYGNVNNINPKKGKNWKDCYNDYKPGTTFQYCNYNYTLLGAIIEKATGQKFFDYIDDNITNPLGLNASFNLTKIDSTLLVKSLVYNRNDKTFKQDNSIYRYGYYESALKNYKLCQSTHIFSPSGGMKASAVDLAKYMMMHMNYGEYDGVRIISKESELEMCRAQGNDEISSDYLYHNGLSFSSWSRIIEGDNIFGVTGNAHGVYSAMCFNPDQKYGFVVICNGTTSDIRKNIVRVLYKHFIMEE